MITWQNDQAVALRKEIESLVAALSGATGLEGLINQSLPEYEKKAGSGKGARPWPLLPLLVSQSIAGQYQPAVPLAASLELFKTAAEIFDDVEDADSCDSVPAKYGNAVAVNLATALLILAEKAITRLTVYIDHRIAVRVMDLINSYYAVACAGQHLDLSLPAGKFLNEEEYFRVSGMKSAFAIECACSAAALLTTQNQELIANFAAFGHNLGLAAQIANDIQGINSGSDILKKKVTLPVIYALSQTKGQFHDEIKAAFLNPASTPMPATDKVRDWLFQTGAIHYAVIKMEYYKQKAREALDRINRKGLKIESLQLFLE